MHHVGGPGVVLLDDRVTQEKVKLGFQAETSFLDTETREGVED